MFKKIKRISEKSSSPRILFITICISILFSILIMKLFYIQIIMGDEYLNDHKKRLEKSIVVSSKRGNIYDRNGKILAYNKITKSLTFDSSLITGYKTGSELNNKINDIVTNLINIIHNNGEEVEKIVPIEIKDDKFQYSVYDQGTIMNFLKEIFSRANINELTNKERNISAEDLINLIAYGENIDEEYLERFSSYKVNKFDDKTKLLDFVNIRISNFLNRYQKYKKNIIVNNIKEQTVIDINENKDILQGIQVEDQIKREYNDSIYVSNIVGYTGYSDSNNESDESAIVGKMGVEKSLDDILKSKDGINTLYIDSTGKVIEEYKTKEAESGDDVYLSIDIDLQKYIYNTIENHLTKYYLDNISNSMFFVKDVRELEGKYVLTSGDIYNSLLTNGLINLRHIKSQDASLAEKNIYASIKTKISEVSNEIKDIFSNDMKIKDLSDDYFNYSKYFFKFLQDKGIIVESKIDTENETVKKWENYDISPKEYLNYLLKNGIINTELLQKETKYLSSDEIFNSVIKYFNDNIYDQTDIIPLISKSLLSKNLIDPRDIISILYDQNILKKDDNYNNFINNGVDTYTFLVELIKNKKLTPGMIALDPFSASVVVNDPNTGKVLAMVSYPGYDNNRMNDNNYISYLFNNKASQLINRPTQLLKAPGSTFKPITAFTSLNEHVTTPTEGILCTGSFDTVKPSVHCWIYPGQHGVMNTVSALANSCNVYFNEMGYRLGLQSTGYYNSTEGINKLKKYASMFGLDRKTGLELDEAQPHISDENAILSAIGQGSHLYNMSNLTRYMSAIATDGKLVNLSIVDKIENKKNGEQIIEPKIIDNINLPQNEFDTIKNGLINVVNMSYNINSFKNVGYSVAGKTGTAEEDLSRYNHSSFIGFSPVEKPKIVTGVLIPNIGTINTEHTDIAGEIMKYYFENIDKE